MIILKKVHITDKQKMILYMIYATYYMPLDVLKNMPITFTESNIKYKLIPRLLQTKLIKRERIGYNQLYGRNNIQNGKALYDTLRLTPSGIHYIKNLGINDDLLALRNFYKKQYITRESLRLERAKKTTLTDYMFDLEFILNIILSSYSFKEGTLKSVKQDLFGNQNFRYFRSLEFKRRNGNLKEMRKIETVHDFTEEAGLAISASKFIGLIDSKYKTIPIYTTSYGNNIRLRENEESIVINKIVANTGKQCNDAVYVYFNEKSINELIKRKEIGEEWRNLSSIADILDYQRIYLLPYGCNSVEYEHLNIQMNIPTRDMRPYWEATKCFKYHDYIFEKEFVDAAIRESGMETFISITDEYNYIIGYLPELRHLKRVFKYYEEHPRSKPLTIICDETQTDFYRAIFKEIMDQGKLYFMCSKFEKGG